MIKGSDETKWKYFLGELELSTNKATFNTWFKGTTAVVEDDTLTITMRNEYAVEWAERLRPTVERLVYAIWDDSMQVVFALPQPKPSIVPDDIPAESLPVAPEPPQMPRKRYSLPDCRQPPFTTVPDMILADVLADAEIGAITKLITFVVLYRTVGDLDKLRRGHEWWEGFSLAELCQAVGVANPKTVRRALQEGVEAGLLKVKPSAISQRQDIALRFEWDD